MYSIKLYHGHGMTFGRSVEMVKTVSAELWWEDDDGTKTKAAITSSCTWTPSTAKRADEWARRKGLDLKADYGAYLRKHGERKEVALERERKEKKAEAERRHQINRRLLEKADVILIALKEPHPALAHYLETGEEWLTVEA